MKIEIFENSKKIDLSTLVDTRALVCANSGGGKSFAIRKILEESNDKVMAIILDVEGEFKTLREKFDFLLIGEENSDVQLNLKSAHLLPKKLLELSVSTIIDISNLKMHERVMYAKKFLEALMEVPRDFWKPCIIVIDEAHLLAGQQEKQESTHAVIDVCTRGRKRGFCAILCSQRISKLHKDAVAECNNYMVGRTGLDIDMKRAAEILGFTSKEQMLSLRDLNPGEFYVFGPALSKQPTKEKVGQVQTTHPKVGMDIRKEIIKPTDKIKSILNKISDLPKEAEQEIKDKQNLEREIMRLRQKVVEASRIQIPEVDPAKIKELEQRAYIHGVKEAESRYKSYINPIQENTKVLQKSILRLIKDANLLLESKAFSLVGDIPLPTVPPPKIPPRPIKTEVSPMKKIEPAEYGGSERLREGAMKMLNWLASVSPNSLTKQRVATLSGFSSGGGTFNTYLSELKRNNWIKIQGDEISITSIGMSFANVSEFPSGDKLLELWCSKFREGAAKILRLVYERQSISKDEIAAETNFSVYGGTFNTYIGELKRNNLILVEGNQIKIAEEFFQ